MTLKDCLPLLASPENRIPLHLKENELITDQGDIFPVVDGLPILLPIFLHPFLINKNLSIPFEQYNDQTLQYFLLSQIKMHGGEHNSNYDNVWYNRHLDWCCEFLHDASGIVIDIGCDKPSNIQSIFPSDCHYLGLDPLINSNNEFRLIGLAEILPLQDKVVDTVCFLTSLDHVFDWHQALIEARRVLRPGGKLYLENLVWKDDADLFRDTVHFHHFREFELFGALDLYGFEIKKMNRYVWKNCTHRDMIFVEARVR